MRSVLRNEAALAGRPADSGARSRSRARSGVTHATAEPPPPPRGEGGPAAAGGAPAEKGGRRSAGASREPEPWTVQSRTGAPLTPVTHARRKRDARPAFPAAVGMRRRAAESARSADTRDSGNRTAAGAAADARPLENDRLRSEFASD